MHLHTRQHYEHVSGKGLGGTGQNPGGVNSQPKRKGKKFSSRALLKKSNVMLWSMNFLGYIIIFYFKILETVSKALFFIFWDEAERRTTYLHLVKNQNNSINSKQATQKAANIWGIVSEMSSILLAWLTQTKWEAYGSAQ